MTDIISKKQKRINRRLIRKKIIKAVYEIEPIFLTKVHTMPSFNKIVESTIDKIIHTDYLKYWYLHNVFKDYPWYNDKFYQERGYYWYEKNRVTNNRCINNLISDKNCLYTLELLEPVGIKVIMLRLTEYIKDNFSNQDIIYDCLNNQKSFTTVIEEKGLSNVYKHIYTRSTVYNKYLCTRLPKSNIEVFHKYIKLEKYNNIIIICKK